MLFKEKEKFVSLSDDATITLQQLIASDVELKKNESLRKQAELIVSMSADDTSDTSIVTLGASIENQR